MPCCPAKLSTAIWYDLRFREGGSTSFLPLGREGLTQRSNKHLAIASLDEFVERHFFKDCVDEMADSLGEVQILIYTEHTPGPAVEPVTVRSVRSGAADA